MKTNKTFAYGNLNRAQRAKVPLLILTVIVILGILFTVSCKTETDPPETITVKKDVTVTFPEFTSGTSLNGTSLNLTPTYGDWGEHFSASDVTYTVTDNKGNEWNSTTGYTIDASVAGYGYSQPDSITFTQTYKMNGVVIASQSFVASISLFGAKQFGALQTTGGAQLTSIPPIDLHLEKTITQ